VTAARTPDGRPLTVAAIIPHPDGRPEVLMSGRVGAAGSAWFWIGGHVDEGEEPAEAALREIGEELEADDPHVVRLLGVLDLHADVSGIWGEGFERGFQVCYVQVSLGSARVRVRDHDELTLVGWKPIADVAEAVASLPAEVGAAAVRFAREALDLRPVACTFTVRGGQLLMVRRREPEGTLDWHTPAGKVEPGETPEQAAAREAEEEAGVVVEVTGYLGSRVHPATGQPLLYFACRWISGEAQLREPQKARAVEWTPIPEALARWDGLKGGVFPAVREYLEGAWTAHVAKTGARPAGE